MSDDLISRKALASNLKLFLNRSFLGETTTHDYISVGEIAGLIKDEPTAYEADKVVEQLEKLIRIEYENPENCDENGFGDGEEIYEDGRMQGKYEAYKKALEIVKSGGVAGE